MVVKQDGCRIGERSRFESSVNSYGSQTKISPYRARIMFESSVNSYGSQTKS